MALNERQNILWSALLTKRSAEIRRAPQAPRRMWRVELDDGSEAFLSPEKAGVNPRFEGAGVSEQLELLGHEEVVLGAQTLAALDRFLGERAGAGAEAAVEWYIELFLGVHFADNLA